MSDTINDEELSQKFRTTMHLMKYAFLQKRIGMKCPLYSGQGQGRVLSFLKIKDNIKTKTLAYILGINVSSLNEILSKLESKGYIERVTSADDQRVKLIKLTSAGRDVKVEDKDIDLMSNLSDQEKKIFSDCLDKINHNIEQKYDIDMEKLDNRRKDAMKKMSMMHCPIKKCAHFFH